MSCAEIIFLVGTGMHWTGWPDRNIDQIKKMPKACQNASSQGFRAISGQFLDVFQTSFRHFVMILFFWAVRRSARYNLFVWEFCFVGKLSSPISFHAGLLLGKSKNPKPIRTGTSWPETPQSRSAKFFCEVGCFRYGRLLPHVGPA